VAESGWAGVVRRGRGSALLAPQPLAKSGTHGFSLRKGEGRLERRPSLRRGTTPCGLAPPRLFFGGSSFPL
jgi:hypothetical protein